MNTMWARLPAPTIVHKHMMSVSERYMAMDEDTAPVDGAAVTAGADGMPGHNSPPQRDEDDGDTVGRYQKGGIIGRQFPALRKGSPDRGYRGSGGSPSRVVGAWGENGDEGGNPPLHSGKKKHQQFLRKITNLQPRVGGPPRPCPSNDTDDTVATMTDGGAGASCATEGDGLPRPGPCPAPGPGGGLSRMASSRTLNSRRGDGGGSPGLDAVTASDAPDRRDGRPRRNGGGKNQQKNPPPAVPNTWYYSSNHILINEERARRNLRTLCRSSDLDDEARIVANAMAERGRVLRSDMNYLAHKIRAKRGDAGGGGAVSVVLGENVGSGRSIREVHAKFLKSPRDRSNMLDGRFREMGIGAVRRGTVTGERSAAGGGADDPSAEVLFVCQLFKG